MAISTRSSKAAKNKFASANRSQRQEYENRSGRKPGIEIFSQEIPVPFWLGAPDDSQRFVSGPQDGPGLRAPHATLAGFAGERIVWMVSPPGGWNSHGNRCGRE